MPRVKKISGGRVAIRGIGRFDLGDEAEVDKSDAEYLVEERGDFEIIGEDDQDDAGDSDEDDAADGGDEADDDGFDVEGWLDQDYQERADRVREGEVDEHLEAIDENETSSTVRDAIGERRAELEG